MPEPAHNSTGSALRGRPFPPGKSGNPGGRPKGFVAAIREATDDGLELVSLMLQVLRGELPGVRLRDRLEAASWLADRGFGKPTVAVDVTASDGWEDSDLARHIRARDAEARVG
jgi:hypothetical protein